MKRIEKLRVLSTFFNDEKPILKQETKVVFNVIADGKRVEPGMTDDEFEAHINSLKNQYSEVLVWNEVKSYKAP